MTSSTRQCTAVSALTRCRVPRLTFAPHVAVDVRGIGKTWSCQTASVWPERSRGRRPPAAAGIGGAAIVIPRLSASWGAAMSTAKKSHQRSQHRLRGNAVLSGRSVLCR